MSVGEGNERVPWNKLANLIQDEFDVTHSEASTLATGALESDWETPFGKSKYGENSVRLRGDTDGDQ